MPQFSPDRTDRAQGYAPVVAVGRVRMTFARAERYAGTMLWFIRNRLLGS
jgi:hypothetical protein